MREDELIVYRTNRNNGFRIDFDYIYYQSRLNTNWGNPVADIGNKIYFLNQFRCRLPYAIGEDLLSVLENAFPLFAQIQGVEIQDLNEGEAIYPVIREIFDRLRSSIRGFRETAASKFMHMTCPNLFAMADSVIADYMQRNNIINHYFIVGEDYIRLLKYYSREINELIEDIMETYGLNRLEAIYRIREKDPYAVGSILRIIDKHFYWLGTH
jgi:hypothetical protein